MDCSVPPTVHFIVFSQLGPNQLIKKYLYFIWVLWEIALHTFKDINLDFYLEVASALQVHSLAEKEKNYGHINYLTTSDAIAIHLKVWTWLIWLVKDILYLQLPCALPESFYVTTLLCWKLYIVVK